MSYVGHLSRLVTVTLTVGDMVDLCNVLTRLLKTASTDPDPARLTAVRDKLAKAVYHDEEGVRR